MQRLVHNHCQWRWCLCLLVMFLASPSAFAVPRFLYTANYFDASISTYRVDNETGMLHHLRHTPTLQSPSALALRPDGKFLYVTSQVLDEIVIYRVDQRSGALTEIKSSPVASGVRSSFRMKMSPDGRLLYVPGRFTQNLMIFRSDSVTGELTPLEENNFPTHGERARFVEVTPDGRFVYVTNTNSNSIAAFSVDGKKESVAPVKGMPFEAKWAPQATMISRSGKYLYVANWQAAELTGYHIHPETGALTPIEGFDAPAGIYPFSGTIHPSGKYLYVTNFASADVSGFQINERNGRLTPIEGMPSVTRGNTPVHVLLDREGKRAYVPNYSDSALTVFDVDEQSGRLVNARWVMTRPGIRSIALLDGETPVRVVAQQAVIVDKNNATISSYVLNQQNGDLELAHRVEQKGLSGLLALDAEHGMAFAGLDKSVIGFRAVENGRLERMDNTSVSPGGDVIAMHVNQRGSHLYITTGNPQQYVAYDIDKASGELSEVDRQSLPDDTMPTDIVTTPDQRLNFIIDSGMDRVFAYRYITGHGPNTFPQENRGSPFVMGKGLSDMVIDATGQFGLMLHTKESSVAVFRMPTVWGPLLPVPNAALKVGKKPVSVSMHPGDVYFYVLDVGGNQIYQLRLDTDNGKLQLTKNTVQVDGEPVALAIEPSGRFAYLRYGSRQGVTRFKINQTTGQLSQPKDMLDNISPAALVMMPAIQ